jgi:hypothetical protein
MSESKTLTHDEKLALATKIMGQMELAGARGKDGYDVIMICAHLLFPGSAVDLKWCNPIRDY